MISSIRWGFLWQRHQALASAAAADGWRVDFLEPHPRNVRQIASFVLGRLGRRSPYSWPTTPPPGLRVLPVSSWLRPGGSGYDLVVCYVPDAWSIRRARRAGGRLNYDAVLDWSTVPATWYPPIGWRRAERRLAAAADAVTTDSLGTREVLAARGIIAEVVHPAADAPFLGAGLPWPEPGTAIYFGAVRDEVDHEVLVELARRGVTVDVVGLIDRASTSDALRAAGVRLHPPVSVEMLAPIVAAHQFVLLPYRGARSATLMPAKFWNCVAIGRWVLVGGIDVPDAGPNLVRVDGNAAAWVAAVEEHRRQLLPPIGTPAPTWLERWQRIAGRPADRLAPGGPYPPEGDEPRAPTA